MNTTEQDDRNRPLTPEEIKEVTKCFFLSKIAKNSKDKDWPEYMRLLKKHKYIIFDNNIHCINLMNKLQQEYYNAHYSTKTATD